MKPDTHRKANGSGQILKDLLEHQKDGRKACANSWGGRDGARKSRRIAKREIREHI